MIHELRTYTLHPGKLADYIYLWETVGWPARGHRYGTLLGFWTGEFGELNRVFHIWQFDGLDERTAVRGRMMRDDRWVKEFLPAAVPMIARQESVILTPTSFSPMKAVS
jgi:NIPSNAP